MEEFNEMLENRPDEVAGDIFDLLLSLSSFSEFKDLMLSYKAENNENQKSFSFGPLVTPLAVANR